MSDAIGIEGSIESSGTTSPQSSTESVISRLEAKLSPPEPEETEAVEDTTSEEAEGEEATLDSDEAEEKDGEKDQAEESEEEEEDEEKDESDEDEEEDSDSEEEDDDSIVLTEEQLAETLGFKTGEVQVDEEGNILFKTNTNGQEAYVPAKELVASYQLEKHNQQKSQKLSEEMRAFEERRTEEETKIGTAVSEATGLVHYLEQKILADYDPQKLAALREQNPAEWSAKRQELQEKQVELQQAKQHLMNTINQKAQEQQQQQIEQHNNYVQEQTQKILEKIPEWSDPKKFEAENTALQKFVTTNYGFTPEEYGATNDHRMFLLMRDAARGRALSDTKPVKAKIKTLPKVVKSGTPQPGKKVRQKKAIEKKKAMVRKSGGNTDSVAALLMERL